MRGTCDTKQNRRGILLILSLQWSFFHFSHNFQSLIMPTFQSSHTPPPWRWPGRRRGRRRSTRVSPGCESVSAYHGAVAWPSDTSTHRHCQTSTTIVSGSDTGSKQVEWRHVWTTKARTVLTHSTTELTEGRERRGGLAATSGGRGRLNKWWGEGSRPHNTARRWPVAV